MSEGVEGIHTRLSSVEVRTRWPDPSMDSQGRPVFVISISKDGFDPYSQQIWAKGNECSHLMPGLPGLPAAVSP
jgi:hypothetical protein